MTKPPNEWEQYAIAALARLSWRTVRRWVEDPESVSMRSRECIERASASLEYAKMRKLLGYK